MIYCHELLAFLDTIIMKKDKDKIVVADLSLENKNVINVLKSSGKSRHSSDFPVLQYYLEDAGVHPLLRDFTEISVNYAALMEDLKKEGFETIFLRETVDEKTFKVQNDQAVIRLQKGYLMEISVGYTNMDEFDLDLQTLLREVSNRENMATLSTVSLLCPHPESPLYSSEIEEIVMSLVKKHKIVRNTTTPSIAMICQEDGQFYVKDFFIKKDYSIKNGDLHYGAGFNEFNKALLERFKLDSKGLVLFHGHPGTGKTYYIRSLIKELLNIGKYVIYLPPNMVESMIYPEMMTFLSSTVLEQAEEGKSCVLLLEDAEPLLASRKTESRSGGITNLLNITDGLLNDMLSIQVIATFNTDLSNIDDALLRPERLIARKEFKKLNVKDAQVLADKLGIEKTISTESSLAEIYSQSKHTEVLIHEYDSNSRSGKIGF